MRIILAGNEEELHRAAYPAFAIAGGDVEAVAGTPEAVVAFASTLPDAVIVVDAALFASPSEALEALAALPNPKAVILPQGWEAFRQNFAALPGLLAGFSAPVSWPEVVAEIRARGTPAATTAHAPTSPVITAPPPADTDAPRAVPVLPTPAPAQQSRPIRVGFWGARGGAGTSTAAVTAARMLASRGRSVLLCDATSRGDLHIMLDVDPRAPARVGGITVQCGLPAESPDGADIVVDGGRTRRNFNAEWVEVHYPLPEERIRRILGLPPESSGKARPSPTSVRRGRLGFVRVELTE